MAAEKGTGVNTQPFIITLLTVNDTNAPVEEKFIRFTLEYWMFVPEEMDHNVDDGRPFS